MKASVIYRNQTIYALLMRVLYGRHYADRYRAVAELIPAGSSVVDVCCGPPVLYGDHLRHKNVDYTGLDLNAGFVTGVTRAGGRGLPWNVHGDTPLPQADIVVMQASLYHFLPDPEPVLTRMLAAARTRVIVAEPVRNLASSDNRLVAALARRFTNAGEGQEADRFTEASLDEFMSRYGSKVLTAELIAGGREKVYVLSV